MNQLLRTLFDFECLGIAYLNDNPKLPVPIKNDMFQSRFRIFLTQQYKKSYTFSFQKL